jgi:hypothetical protein
MTSAFGAGANGASGIAGAAPAPNRALVTKAIAISLFMNRLPLKDWMKGVA